LSLKLSQEIPVVQHIFKEMLPVVIYLKVGCYVCYIRYCELQSSCNVTCSCTNNYGDLVEWYWQGTSQVLGEKTSPSVHQYNTNPAWIGLGHHFFPRPSLL